MDRDPPLARLTDRKHAAILEAAVAEFRAAGYEATSMDRIASRAGVSKRTVYNHFPGKDALFLRILESMLERGVCGPDLAYRADRPLRPQLLELVRQKLRLLHDPEFVDLARVAIAAGIHSPALARDLLSRLGDREEGVSVWIRAAAADGRLRTDDPAFASMQLQGLVKSFALWPQLSMGQPPLSAAQRTRVAESAVDMFLAYYG
ncbi:TetR family transcriptional regulator [Xanthomonas citri pv. mangiferaeindicae]|uniref:TetR/AcrR family transcriptional regulator n=1 Tax=Luteimonas sp. gir TaxID=3127960 RepID=UPI000B8D5F5E|nr:TetR family transcriptional regulator [Xanthomonas citri pv. mangiferaeindicae]